MQNKIPETPERQPTLPLAFPLDRRRSTEQAAEYLGRTPATLALWRKQGRGPRWFRLGDSGRSPVFYLVDDLDAFIAEHMARPTSQQGGGK